MSDATTSVSNEPAVQAPATEPSVAPEVTTTPEVIDENKEAAAPKTFTEEELKAQLDAEAAKIRNKYERKLEKARIEQETRAKVMSEISQREVEAPAKPAPEQFTDYADYLEALADYKAEEKFAAMTQKQKDAERTAKHQSEVERQTERKNDMIHTGETKYSDFEEVIANSKAQLSEVAYLAILETENSADIAYYLATNQTDADRIAALSPYAQAKEIGKLEDKLSAKPPVKLSNAPSPIKPIEGGKNLTKKLEDMTYEEMREHDRKRGARYLNH